MRQFLLVCIVLVALVVCTEGRPPGPLRYLPSITYDTLEGYGDSAGSGSAPRPQRFQPIREKKVEFDLADRAEVAEDDGWANHNNYQDHAYDHDHHHVEADPVPVRHSYNSYSSSEHDDGMTYLTPFRVIRRMTSEIGNAGSAFAKTLSKEMSKSYRTLSKDLMERVLPQAANLLGVWKNPPKDESSEWMDGI